MQFQEMKPIYLFVALLMSLSSMTAQSNFLSTGGYLVANDNSLSDPNGQSNLDNSEFEIFEHSFMEKPSSSSSIVPVELSSFEVEVISKQEVMVRWTTNLEIENDFFEIEKSKDGVHWYSIGELDGNGTKFENSVYMYIDKSPTVGRSFYRLKQVNYDQEFAFSNRSFVNIHEDDFQIYPNPTRDKIFLFIGNFSKDLNYKIIDIVGHTHFTGVLVDIETEIDVSNLAQGTYLIQIDSGIEQYRKPMVFVKTK